MATLVTGAHGHVGAALVRELISRGRDVVTFDLQGGPGLDGLDVTSHTGDVRDADALRTAMAGCSTVFHLASVISTSGDKGGLVSSVNVDGARRVAEVAQELGVQRMVHTSSIHAYDIDTHGPPVTESTDLAIGKSRSAYNVSKAALKVRLDRQSRRTNHPWYPRPDLAKRVRLARAHRDTRPRR